MIRFGLLILALLLSPLVKAQDSNTKVNYANVQLSDPEMEEQAYELMLKLRCIQCQSQSIADSDAPIAEAMRHQVRLRVKNGENNDDIKKWMIARYGDYVSFEPPSSGLSILLWVGPMLVFALAIFIVLPLFRNKEKTNEGDL